MTKRALIVGVDNYEDVEINPLKFAVDDASKLSGLFEFALRFDHVQHLRDPSKEQLMEAACKMVEGLGAGDLFVFFFAGHGTEYQNHDLLLFPRANRSRMKYFDHALPVDQLRDETGHTKASRLFILDACRNNLFSGRGMSDSGSTGFSTLRDIGVASAKQSGATQSDYSVLCACGEGQQAREIPAEGQGLFSLALKQVLDNSDKSVIKLNDEFVSELRKRMAILCTQYGFSDPQTPWVKHSGEPPVLFKQAVDECEVRSTDKDESEKKNRHREQEFRQGQKESINTHEPKEKPKSNKVTEPLSGSNWVEPTTGMEFVWVPSGEFMMGSPNNEKERNCSEGPQHRVALSGFWMGKYQITQAEWQQILGNNPSLFKVDRNPVENISWEDTQEFLKELNRQTGMQYRLSSESEWEYAARAGTAGVFSFTGQISDQKANYDASHSYLDSPKGEYRGKTVEVGSYPANPWGLHDMHGNVYEWTQDCWNGNYKDAPSDGSAWQSGDESCRVLRGGSWHIKPGMLRSANRYWYRSDSRYNFTGARLVLSPLPQPGDTLIEPFTGMEFIWVPSGQLIMEDVFNKPLNEALHGFWMGKYPVTQSQWKQVMGNNPSHFQVWGFFEKLGIFRAKGEQESVTFSNRPVEQVSREDTLAFIKKLIQLSPKLTQCFLPTLAQWIYAASYGSKSKQYAGSDNMNEVAWFTHNSSGITQPVGLKAPNGIGLYDMSGNVWEWCLKNSELQNEDIAGNGQARLDDFFVACGGSWDSFPAKMHTSVSQDAAWTGAFSNYTERADLGFRLVIPFSKNM